ncbi:MAG: hypothetical protein LAP61_16430 [Acidobacteriia bacterium]|nr:hypothetical protein [Terriglobia bacterium]
MTIVHISGCRRGFLLISFVKLLRSATGEGLASAFDKANRLVENREEIRVEFGDAGAATKFLNDAEGIGAIGTLSAL